MSQPAPHAPPRPTAWTWWVCGLLLLATAINYMDRVTLNQVGDQVMEALDFKERGYGDLEAAFAYAFALGALLFGWLSDRVAVRWLYPFALFAWSAMGFATGVVDGFLGLLVCRFLLGLFEAGHWPCALRTTQHILPPAQRPMGNSILQSGAAIGAIATPLLILALGTTSETWRYPFLIVGGVGVLWVFLWLASVRAGYLDMPQPGASPFPLALFAGLIALLVLKTTVRGVSELPDWVPLAVSVAVSAAGVWLVSRWLMSRAGEGSPAERAALLRRFCVLLVLVVAINATWHFFRAWLPLFLKKQHRYGNEFTQWYTIAYYVSTDVGSLSAGAAALLLARRGTSVHRSRSIVFGVLACLCLLGALAAFLPRGPMLLATLLVLGFASLGLFPLYYSLTQELAPRHQGKVTGALGCCNWLAMAPIHESVGHLVEQTGSYAAGMATVSFAPLVGVGVMLLLWTRNPFAKESPSP